MKLTRGTVVRWRGKEYAVRDNELTCIVGPTEYGGTTWHYVPTDELTPVWGHFAPGEEFVDLNFNTYQEQALTTFTMPQKGVSWREQVYYTTLKLNGEAGEVAEKIGKIIRDQEGHFTDVDKLEIIKELGDVLWYCAVLAHLMGFLFQTVAITNIQKLIDRKNRGVLHGSGDNR